MPDRLIYHITHVDNLAGIIEADRLWCDAQRIAQAFPNRNIGYNHIKARRMRHPVTVSNRGNLGNYVPFNFCPRSVMLFVVSCGHEDYGGGQSAVIHLVSSIDTIAASGRPWFFTDRHADLAYARQLETLDKLNEVDFSVMPRRQWGGNEELKEKRQAEFLVHDWCPWSAINAIGVMNAETVERVNEVSAQVGHQPIVQVQRDWYY